jgi:phospholipase/carboxylesterase
VLVRLATACHDGRVSPADAPRYVERTIPARRTTPGAPPPLLVMLHGIGADENDLLPLFRELDPRLTVVSLRAPRQYHVGYAWFQIAWRPDGSIVPDVAQAHEALPDLVRWIEAAPSRLATDPARLYVLGFSQGAMMSYGVLRTAPERLAGLIALSGRFSDELFPATASPGAIARVPVFMGHGTRDDLLPVANGRAARDLLQPLVRDLTYREYPIGHGISPEELRDVAAWLTERLDRPRP